MPRNLTRAVAVVVVAGLSVALAACGASQPSPDAAATLDPNAKVTITVGEMPLADQAANRAQFERAIKDFEALHPNVTVVGSEMRYDTQTFSSLLVGGQLPTTLGIPFTDIQALVSRQQAADVTPILKADEVLAESNPNLVKGVTGSDGRIFGLVRAASTQGLLYDRAVYKKAGLDPDSPPTTWDEVLRNAAIIKQKTGATGFMIPTVENFGGWLISTIAYSFGSKVEEVDGDKATVTLATEGMHNALQFLHDLRWKEDAAGQNFLMSFADMRDALAGGNVAQTVLGANQYFDLVVRRGMPPENVGIAPIPMPSDKVGVLGGGTVQWFNPKATLEQLNAAVQFTKFYYLDRYLNEETALKWAKAQEADRLPIGAPEYPVVSREAYDRYLGWISPMINVKRDNYAAYIESTRTVPVALEPPVRGQELYAALDPVVQAVLTREDADIDALLEQAQAQVQALVDQK